MKKKIKILIVDDDKTICTTLAQILREEKYEVVAKETGKSALALLDKYDFNVIIVDLKLPDIDGLTLLEKVREKIPDIIGIVITAYPGADTAISALKKEVSDYIIKPFDVNQIKVTIRKSLERKMLERENRKLLSILTNDKENLTKILQIGRKMSSFRSVKKIANFLVEKSCELLKAEKGSLMLLEKDKLVIVASKGIDKKVAKTVSVKLGEAIAGWVAQYGKPLLVKDIEKEMRISSTRRQKYKSKSFLSLPLKVKGKVIGVVNVTDKIDENKIFNTNDLKYLSIIVNQGAAILENTMLYEKLANEAITDSITGVFNHRYFKIQLQREIKRSKRYSYPLSLIMIDIDYFKKYNDTYGHLMGDLTLKLIAEVLKDNIRTSDILCRYGGDEFVIILPHTNLLSAMNVAEKLRKTVENYNLYRGGPNKSKKQIHLTISLGISAYRDGDTAEELIKQADQALYRAKKSGRNNSVFAFKEV